MPQNETNAPYKLYIFSDLDVYGNEGNICTKSQVAVAKAKGWTPYYYDNIENIWLEYEGSEDEDTSIAMPEVEDGNSIVYTLSGQKVTKAKKGIYIVNGKKVVVK